MIRSGAILALVLCVAVSTAAASSLWVGNDTLTAVQRYDSTTGTFLEAWGQGSATGSALDGLGHLWTVAPGGPSSHIEMYDSLGALVSSVDFTTGIENGNGFPSWIEDMTYGGAGTLWVSGFNGIVYHLDSTASILSSFDTGHLYPGVATDGSVLYTTDGFDGDKIYTYSFGGSLLGSVSTGIGGGLGGIGYDSTDGTLWVGGTAGVLYHVTTGGTVLGSFTTPTSSAFHDGLEVGEIGGIVPEPATLGLFGLGAFLLAAGIRRRSARS
jgi:hypothetical protein